MGWTSLRDKDSQVWFKDHIAYYLQTLLERKEIKLVNPKGNQLWIFTGRTDAEAGAPMLWPPDAKSQLTGKEWKQKMLVKIEGKRREVAVD